MPRIQIYTDSKSSRLQYACHIIFDIVLETGFEILTAEVNGKNEVALNQPFIFYGTQKPTATDAIWIQNSGFLFKNKIEPVNTKACWKDGYPYLFPTNDQSSLGFDLFAAIFFMASRYEEYLPFVPDSFGRFPEKASVSGQFGFTHLPVVHIWAAMLQEILKKRFPAFSGPNRKAKAIFTYDIDVAYAYKGRSALQKALSLGNDVLKGNFGVIKEKIVTRFGKKSDPSDTYEVLENNPLQKIAFFLLTSKRTKFDRNISPDSPLIPALVNRLFSAGATIGIHPSFYSLDKPLTITGEKQTLESILKKPVTLSRQHFLKFRLPDTYRQLYDAGIRHDYSMQYPEMPGFRAGLCLPYPFFDLLQNKVTDLMIHPGCIMETTFRDDLLLPASKSLSWYLDLWYQVQQAGGEFISIWHNDTLWDGLPAEHPLAFRQIHEKLISKISDDLSKS